MKEPNWLLPDAVLAMHAECIAEHGGSDGVRDVGLLQSALARPRHLFAYEKAEPCRLAAAYGHGIAKNHPFVDGNKRTAFLATVVFLLRNGLDLTATPAQAAVCMLAVADGTLGEVEFAAWLHDHSRQARRSLRRVKPRKRR